MDSLHIEDCVCARACVLVLQVRVLQVRVFRLASSQTTCQFCPTTIGAHKKAHHL